MSKSYHATRKDLKGKSKAEIDEMFDDSDSVLHELAEKRFTKREVLKQRQKNKKIDCD